MKRRHAIHIWNIFLILLVFCACSNKMTDDETTIPTSAEEYVLPSYITIISDETNPIIPCAPTTILSDDIKIIQETTVDAITYCLCYVDSFDIVAAVRTDNGLEKIAVLGDNEACPPSHTDIYPIRDMFGRSCIVFSWGWTHNSSDFFAVCDNGIYEWLASIPMQYGYGDIDKDGITECISSESYLLFTIYDTKDSENAISALTFSVDWDAGEFHWEDIYTLSEQPYLRLCTETAVYAVGWNGHALTWQEIDRTPNT